MSIGVGKAPSSSLGQVYIGARCIYELDDIGPMKTFTHLICQVRKGQSSRTCAHSTAAHCNRSSGSIDLRRVGLRRDEL